MAYQTGTVDNYRQLLKTFAQFVTEDAGVAAEGGNWALNTGRVSSQAVEYLTNTSVGEDGLLQWDKSVAMGWDDTFSALSYPEGYYGWKTFTTDIPDGYLGFESAVAILPATYKITAVNWAIDNADEHPMTWKLEYSDDNSIWIEGDDVSTAGGGTYGDQTAWTQAEVREFAVPGALGTHKYWRLRFTANNGDATLLSLGRLRFYNITPDWISYSYTNEYQFVAPGLTATEEIYTGIRLFEHDINDYHNFNLMGAIGFDVNEPFSSQPFGFSGAYLALYDQPLKYWLCANGQRAVMVVKVSTVYVTMYIGKYLPYATPAQHPYPLMISGSSSYSTYRWSSESPYHGCLPTVFQYGGTKIFTSGNEWVEIVSRAVMGSNTSNTIIFPVADKCVGSTGNVLSNVLQNPDGSYCILPLILGGGGGGSHDKGLLGEIEGLFWVTGNGNLAENILSIDGQDYLVYQNIFRTNYQDYGVLELK